MAPLIKPDKVIPPEDPIVLELANTTLPLSVELLVLLLYKALPLTPLPLSVKLLELLYPFRSKAAPELTVMPLATPLSTPTSLSVLLAVTEIEPVDPDTVVGIKVVKGFWLELATLMIKDPLSVTEPVPSEPTPVAFPTCSVVPV